MKFSQAWENLGTCHSNVFSLKIAKFSTFFFILTRFSTKNWYLGEILQIIELILAKNAFLKQTCTLKAILYFKQILRLGKFFQKILGKMHFLGKKNLKFSRAWEQNPDFGWEKKPKMNALINLMHEGANKVN